MSAVEAQGLSKTYRGGHFWAPKRWVGVRGVSLTVGAGEIFGLLGPNGAGKTTTVKLLVSLLTPDAGAVRVLGGSPGDPAVRARIGYISEFPYFPRQLSAWEVLRFHAELHGFSGRAALERVRAVLADVGLSGRGETRIGEMSKGMQQRVGWAQGLLNDPELLFVDEPMSGLDPLGVIEIRELMLAQRRAGRTVFFNSHLLSEVEQVADRVAILVEGRLALVRAVDAKLRGGGLEKLFVDTVRAQGASGLSAFGSQSRD